MRELESQRIRELWVMGYGVKGLKSQSLMAIFETVKPSNRHDKNTKLKEERWRLTKA